MKYLLLFILSFNVLAFIDNEKTIKEQSKIKQYFWDDNNSILDVNVDFYLNQIARRLKPTKNIKLFLIDSPEINAFATKYGLIGINKGLVNITDNEEELLAVIAHEIAHINLHHFERLEGAKNSNLILLGGILLSSQIKNSELSNAVINTSIAESVQQKINWVRSHEVEADNYAQKMFIDNKLNLSAMSSFFTKLKQNPDAIEYLQTHPLAINRASNSYTLDKKYNNSNSIYYQMLIATINKNSNYSKALELFKNNKFTQALELLEPNNEGHKILIGRIYASLGNINKAREYLSGDNELAKYYLAELHFLNKEPEQAINILKRHNYIKPNYYYYQLLEKIYLEQDALDRYHYTFANKALLIGDIKNAKIQFNLAKNYSQNKNLHLKIDTQLKKIKNF